MSSKLLESTEEHLKRLHEQEAKKLLERAVGAQLTAAITALHKEFPIADPLDITSALYEAKGNVEEATASLHRNRGYKIYIVYYSSPATKEGMVRIVARNEGEVTSHLQRYWHLEPGTTLFIKELGSMVQHKFPTPEEE